MRHFGAFADYGFFRFHKISNARAFLEMRARANARKRSDGVAAIEMAVGNHRVRLDGDAVAENCVVQNAAGANDAMETNLGFAEQLHARLDSGVFPRGDVRPNEHGLWQLDGDARI